MPKTNLAQLVNKLLDTSIGMFKGVIKVQERLFYGTPIKKVDPDPNKNRHWEFSTTYHEDKATGKRSDLKINAFIYKPDYVRGKFEDNVRPLYRGAYGKKISSTHKEFADNLLQDTIFYLLFHELFHSLYSPQSKDDREKTDVAIYNGLKKAGHKRASQGRDIINKLGNVRNAVHDFIIDDIFYYLSSSESSLSKQIGEEFEAALRKIDVEKIKKMPDGVISTWDVVELADQTPNSEFYPITRIMYSTLFTKDHDLRGRLVDYFKGKMKESMRNSGLDEDKIDYRLKHSIESDIKKALKGIIAHVDDDILNSLNIDKLKYEGVVDVLCDNYNKGDNKVSESHKYVVESVTKVFLDKRARYGAVTGMIEHLAKYINLENEENRHGADTEPADPSDDSQTDLSQSGGNAEQALESLINQLGGTWELENLLQGIANDNTAPRSARNRRLENLAADQYYKEKAKPLKIKAPKYGAEGVELGKKQEPYILGADLITAEELANLDLEQLAQRQIEMEQPILIGVTQLQWELRDIENREVPIMDYQNAPSGIELPKNIVFHVDSSASMGGGNGSVGSGSRYDGLNHAVYGITKDLRDASVLMDEKINIIIVNYSGFPGVLVNDEIDLDDHHKSSGTLICGPVDVAHFYDTPNNKPKQVLLNAQDLATYYQVEAYQVAQSLCEEGKTLHVFIADGDLDTEHYSSLAEIEKLLQTPDTSVLYFLMFGGGRFGRLVHGLESKYSNLKFFKYNDFNDLQATSSEFMIHYSKQREPGRISGSSE